MVLLATFLNPAVVALLVAAPTAVLGYLAYRQSKKVDAVAGQIGIAAVESGNITTVVEGLNSLVQRLQDDNAVLRELAENLRDDNAELRTTLERCEKRIIDLQEKVERLDAITDNRKEQQQ